MEYFTVSRRLRGQMTDFGGVIDFDVLPGPASAPRHVYVTTREQAGRFSRFLEGEGIGSLLHILPPPVKDAIEHAPGFPPEPRFGDADGTIRTLARGGGRRVRIALFNGMSNAIGDSVVGLNALDLVKAHLERCGLAVGFDLLRTNPRHLWPLYRGRQAIERIAPLPVSLDKLRQYDMVVRLEDALLTPAFNAMPMIDWFLEKLGLAASLFPAEAKRNRLALEKAAAKAVSRSLGAIRAEGRKLLLLHPTASDLLRSMPPGCFLKLVEAIEHRRAYRVLCTEPAFCTEGGAHDISALSRSLDAFIAIVAAVDAVVTVDTATYHIADAFDVPTVVLFTTIAPELRIPYYPHVAAVRVPVGAALAGRHKGGSDAEDGEALAAAFDALDVEHVLDALDRVTAALP